MEEVEMMASLPEIEELDMRLFDSYLSLTIYHLMR